ncbi:SDR family oxidoreductase [Mycobacterium montefiorense]|uniref:LysR family transcriptional regulator n=1 Tax=Mycobacterium montefiorense TaxID=154654 RepID=A0AA37PLJ7_9MYCO|nr:SDR family oxidoreductase [Mycobacterium montefiorense]GBG40191.1 LysR family transcriptional regulator [Mycobacterium montefiorense]GKU35284.1 LysR family transcriptional regulator [Mycobacterium montefiorense]GKU40238.1 LysR family transcriptional regulator [Mycobacterium montefiorense]GKU46177.1 LysR family transcriptional regulator [Mycobacterium montefiorense]GKU53049.1 LysR family transcriptional regulator [Mycobacterium montefiorense]
MKVLVVGGSGLIGSQVVAMLTEQGHEAVPASPSSGVNAITGAGVAEAVAGVHTVVDVSNSPSWADDDVLEFFTTSTRNLLEAERAAGVAHHVALSIVGAERLPDSGYMRAKVAQEKVLRESGSPHSIVRATQFFEFVGGIADSLADGDTVRAPHGAFQPISSADVATAVTSAATGDPTNGVINIAGPEKQGMDDFIRTWFAATGDARQVVTDPDARYYGAVLDDSSIVPIEGEKVTVYPTNFSDWIPSRA